MPACAVIDEIRAATGNHVQLVALVRLLLVRPYRCVQLDRESAALEDGKREISGRRGPPSERVRETHTKRFFSHTVVSALVSSGKTESRCSEHDAILMLFVAHRNHGVDSRRSARR